MNKQVKLATFTGLAIGLSTAGAIAKSNGGYLWTKGGPNVKISVGDGIPDPIKVYPRYVVGENFTFAITDSDSNVLAYTTENIIDLEEAGGGKCLVYGIAYAGDFDMPTGVPVSSLSASESLSVSRNRIAITRQAVEPVDGGWIISDGRGRGTVKINLNKPYPVRAYSTSKAAPGSNYAYVITDNEGMVLAYPPANQFDFNGAPAGICRVYGISHTGTLDTTTGISIMEVMSDTDTQELSKNYIRVFRYEK